MNFSKTIIRTSCMGFKVIMNPGLVLKYFSRPRGIFAKSLRPVRCKFVIVIRFANLVVVSAMTTKDPCPCVIIQSFRGFTSNVIQRIKIILMVLLRKMTIMFIRS